VLFARAEEAAAVAQGWLTVLCAEAQPRASPPSRVHLRVLRPLYSQVYGASPPSTVPLTVRTRPVSGASHCD
jgi:hypothetical protein